MLMLRRMCKDVAEDEELESSGNKDPRESKSQTAVDGKGRNCLA